MLGGGAASWPACRCACSPARRLVVGRSALVAIWIEPYRRERFLASSTRGATPQGAGFQTVQAMIGLGSGGLFGEGLGEGVQKIFYLPEAHTDMIFAIVGEELGLVGDGAVICAYAAFAYAGLRDRARAAATRSASGSPPA